MIILFERNWWALALRGVAAIGLGVLTFFWPGMTLLALILLFGSYALVDGIFAVVIAVRKAREEKYWWAILLEGLLGIAAGVITFLWPGITAFGLVYLIAVWAVLTGALEIATAIRLRKVLEGEWILALSGVASIAFGVLIAVFPQAGALSLILIIGGYMLAFGVLLLVLAFKLRKLRDRHHQLGNTPDMAPSR